MAPVIGDEISFTGIINRVEYSGADITSIQGRIKLFGAPRQWKNFRPLFQAVFLSGGGLLPPRLIQTPRLPVPKQK